MKKTFITLYLVLCFCFTYQTYGSTRLLHQPDILGDKVVFVYAADIWTTSVNGGNVKRLTTHPGMESSPKFSPDGKWIAFTAEYDGNADVFIIPSEGGNPKRLTFHPAYDAVLGWTPKGNKILFKSARNSFHSFNHLFTIGINGGFP